MDEKERIVFLPASRLAGKIRGRELTCAKVLEAFLDRIAAQNGRLNAVVTLNAAAARRQAAEADKALQAGADPGPLHGVPITVKDQFATRGLRTTVGLPKWSERIPDFSATIVERLLKAGAIIIGKTNLPPLANDHQTRNPIFGTTNNPWNTEYTPGGSSGGGAASVAAGMSALDIGSDLGGSLRQPAHFCGIYGLKPTENLVPGSGVYPKWPGSAAAWPGRLFSYGPLARSVADLALCLPIIAGPDGRDLQVPRVPLSPAAPKEFKNISLAWSDCFDATVIDAEMKELIAAFIRRLEAVGCGIRYARPDLDYAQARSVYGQMVDLEIGIRMKPMQRLFLKLKGRKYRAKIGLQDMICPVSHKKYLQASAQRAKFVSILERFLLPLDGWLCPVTPMPAFRHHVPRRHLGFNAVYEKPLRINDRKMNYWDANACFTTLFNLTGHPVVVMPVGLTRRGLPVGIQLAGRLWHDMELLAVAEKIAGLTRGFAPPPDENRCVSHYDEFQ